MIFLKNIWYVYLNCYFVCWNFIDILLCLFKVLVVGFLVFVRVYVVLDKIEKSLEEEIVKENRKLFLNCFGRLGVFLYWWFW